MFRGEFSPERYLVAEGNEHLVKWEDPFYCFTLNPNGGKSSLHEGQVSSLNTDPKSLLPPGHLLAVNSELGTVIQIANGNPFPSIIHEESFTSRELSLLLPLLLDYPNYCPNERMLTSFNQSTLKEREVEKTRNGLYEALQQDIDQPSRSWDEKLRPLRNVLSRTRLKLRPFKIDIGSILVTGYILLPLNIEKPTAKTQNLKNTRRYSPF